MGATVVHLPPSEGQQQQQKGGDAGTSFGTGERGVSPLPKGDIFVYSNPFRQVLSTSRRSLWTEGMLEIWKEMGWGRRNGGGDRIK